MPSGNSRSPLDTLGEFFSWEKDKNLRYIRCSESYAEAAGLDSPGAIVGKTDFQMPWRKLADLFREGDQAILDGRAPHRIFSQEKEISVYGPLDILVSERPLLNAAGERVGVTGHFQNITGHSLVPNDLGQSQNITRAALIRSSGPHYIKDEQLHLGGKFGNLHLTKIETQVLGWCWQGLTSKQIAIRLAKSHRTVEAQIDQLRKKLQCQSKGDLVQLVISEGLHLILFPPRLVAIAKALRSRDSSR
jgi:DNA-binding CsgD family transcriptional regulator